MKNLIKSIKNYELANDEFRISLVLFVLTLVLATLENMTGIVWLGVPVFGTGMLCAVFALIGFMKCLYNED